MTESQHEQYQDPETEAAKWNSAVIDFIIYSCAFTAMSSVKKVNCYLFLFSKTFSFQIQSDVFYCAAILSVLMLDEAHERTLYTDIAIGLLKKVIITLQFNFNLYFSSLEKNPRKF